MKFVKVEGVGNEYLYNPVKKGESISEMIWVCRRRAGKPRLCKSLKTKNRPEARRLRDTELEIWLGLVKKPDQRVSLDKIQEKVLLQKKSMVKRSTYLTMISAWNALEPYFGNVFIDELNSNHWKAFVSKIRQNKPNHTLFNEYKHLLRLITYSFDSGLLDHRVKIELPKSQPTKAKIYTPDEITLLLLHADPVYMKYMIPMGCELGMRTHEITQLPKEYVNLKDRVIRLPNSFTKTGASRTIPLGHVYDLVAEKYLSNASPYMFPSPVDEMKPISSQGHKRAWAKCKKESRVSGRFYDLRHTCATRMAKTISPALAAKILGHDLKMFFSVYCKPSDQDLKTEFEKMSSNE